MFYSLLCSWSQNRLSFCSIAVDPEDVLRTFLLPESTSYEKCTY